MTSIGNANLKADNEIQVKGSNIAVTGGLQLDAKDISLLAGDNSSTSTSDSSSHSENASYSTNGGPSGSLSASETESTSESNYYTNTQITAGTLSSDSENLTLSGANVDAGVVGITTENLLVESLQNTSTSTSETKGANVGLNGSGSPTSGGINQQASESSTAWVDQQSSITGGDVTIKAKDTTIKGGLIAAVDDEGNDLGNLSLQTDTLSVEDLQDHSTSSDKGFSLDTGEGSTTVGANYSGHDTEQTTKATIGSGGVTVSGEQLAEGTVNRDINNSQEITKDHELGGLDATVTVDHRLATEEGREEIVSDIEDTVEIAQKAAETAVHTTTFVVEEFNRDALSDMAKSQNSEMMGEMLVQQIEAANPDANISPEERQQLVDTLGNKYSGQYEDLTSIGNMNTHDDAMSEIVNGMVGDLNTLNNALNGISEDGYKKVGGITSTGQQALNALLGVSGAAATTNSANDSNWVQEEQDHMNMDSFDSPYGGSSTETPTRQSGRNIGAIEGSEIVESDNTPYTYPSDAQIIDQLLENIPPNVSSSSTESPIQDDLGLGLVLSEKKSGVPADDFVPNPTIDEKYKRPRGAGPTKEQKESVQNKPCVDCGVITPNQVADHIDPLVVEFYRDGKNDTEKQKQVEAVQPHCPTCSSSQGGQLGSFGKKMKETLGL